MKTPAAHRQRPNSVALLVRTLKMIFVIINRSIDVRSLISKQQPSSLAEVATVQGLNANASLWPA